MKDIKCPICNSNLIITHLCDGIFPNPNKGKIDEIFCDKCKMRGTEELWQALTDSMKEHDLCHDALVERTKELDRTRKALDVAKKALNDIQFTDDGSRIIGIRSFAHHALEQITAEQKDVK